MTSGWVHDIRYAGRMMLAYAHVHPGGYTDRGIGHRRLLSLTKIKSGGRLLFRLRNPDAASGSQSWLDML
jgi:hypothetical protein